MNLICSFRRSSNFSKNRALRNYWHPVDRPDRIGRRYIEKRAPRICRLRQKRQIQVDPIVVVKKESAEFEGGGGADILHLQRFDVKYRNKIQEK